MFRDNIFRILVFTIGFSAASWAKDPTPDMTPQMEETTTAAPSAQSPQKVASLPFE